ncbi:F0F1 ATP synthase subunit B [Sphingomonas sp. ID1715]|uniref:F0F1 ATP synthase subunit B family protein n=1 Tax=Sphingomonas sp. ID1715 TaxID=1656898 RepID=UPI001488E5F7|nr:F0F1 ATP synthase subunit B [Sphingomonas sp. ID1715]NNM76304.1 F0F1 ATP synthase subunit B [Sphingomonas sp. ID1715]
MAENVSAGSAEVAHNLSEADKLQGSPHTGGEALEGHAGGVGETNHPDPAALGMDATAWVSLAMVVFIVILLLKKVPGLITRGLDNQIAAIRQRLDEAKTLRAEAEALRDEYARKIAGAEQDAAKIVAHAQEESKTLIADAEQKANELSARRVKMAEDKIAAAERQAIAEVRAKAAEAAAAAAAKLIAERHDANADKALVDRTISGLGSVH